MDYDVTITIAENGRDADAGERLLDALAEVAPDTGPVVDQSLRTGALSATLTVAAQDADDAYGRARRAFTEGAKTAGLDFGRVFSVHVDPVGVAAELQPA